ncbi:MAG: LacI family DNA-binding transcriptional regulator [Verrucomicrobia bacterium]|nr:LacI family DNA-binding transcriptional regulator [Verrucomicrobiota bacterium]
MKQREAIMDRVPTMRDVASLAGVSPATVSLALRNHSAIKLQTRERVLQAQRDLGYRVNRHAQRLIRGCRTGGTRVLESLVFALVDGRFDDPSYAPFLQGIIEESKTGHHVQIHTDTLKRLEMESSLESPWIRDGRADGIIISGFVDEKICRHLESFGIPIVVLGAYDLPPAYEQVDCDVPLLAREATRRLLSNGRRRIAFLCNNTRIHYNRRALAGYQGALHDASLALPGDYVVSMNPNPDVSPAVDLTQGAAIIDRLMALNPKPDAVVFTGGRYADECCVEMRARQIKMPEELEIMALATRILDGKVRLYESVLLDAEMMGRIAFRRLKERVENPTSPPTVSVLRTVQWFK